MVEWRPGYGRLKEKPKLLVRRQGTSWVLQSLEGEVIAFFRSRRHALEAVRKIERILGDEHVRKVAQSVYGVGRA
jgi:hypothetical protein